MGGFTFSPVVKVYLLIDSSKACKQSTETTLAGFTYADDTTSQLISVVILTTKQFSY